MIKLDGYGVCFVWLMYYENQYIFYALAPLWIIQPSVRVHVLSICIYNGISKYITLGSEIIMQYTWPSCKTGAARCIIYSMEWVRLEWQNPWWFWGEIIEIQDGTSLMKREKCIVQISKGANLFVWPTSKEKEHAVFRLGRYTGARPNLHSIGLS